MMFGCLTFYQKGGYAVGLSTGLFIVIALIFLFTQQYSSPFIIVIGLIFGGVFAAVLGQSVEHLFWDIPSRYKTIADAVQLIAWQRFIQHHKQDTTLAISKNELERRLKELICNYELSGGTFDKIDSNRPFL